jgi:precorrin-2 dehydrogenase/sirohydrochlorin ferrochelatase
VPSYYPIFLDLRGKRCVVVGGGPVAERKVVMLLERDAAVTVVSPALSPGLREMARRGAVRVVEREYRKGDLEGAFLAIAATDDAPVNAAVSSEARERRALVNVVDGPDDSDFIVPSLVRRGDITVAVSTGGRSPALARKLRTVLEGTLTPEYASVLDIVSDVREELARRGVRVDGDTWQRCLDIDALLGMIGEGRLDGARQMLLDRLLDALPPQAHPATGDE